MGSTRSKEFRDHYYDQTIEATGKGTNRPSHGREEKRYSKLQNV